MTCWEGTATAGTLAAEGLGRASHNPSNGSTASYKGWAERKQDPESLGEPLQGLSSRLSVPSCHMGLAALPSPAARPVPSPLAPWLGQGSAQLPQGDHARQLLLQPQGMRMGPPFTQQATELGKSRRLGA